MNPDLYTEEFRNFKYLKSSPEAVRYYKRKAKEINSVPNFNNDLNFTREYRIEFLEQLLDLHPDTIYLVYGRVDIGFHSALYKIVKPVLYKGTVLQPESGTLITSDDIKDVDYWVPTGWWLCTLAYYNHSASNRGPESSGQVFSLAKCILSYSGDYCALFYDKDSAEEYSRDLSIMLSKGKDAVSAISRLL